ncbi:MAG TPA: hypothetical protein ENJ70_02950 [Thermoplasmatales archaeon]|nr:hypothetical protein [Thermoplasmatales archaeon]
MKAKKKYSASFIFMPMKVRIAAKQIEKKLTEMANRIKENPEMLIPECRGDCRRCYFEKIRKELKSLNKQNLERAANRKGFVAAVAATMLLAEQKIPYVAHMNIGGESVYYARRGKAKDEILVGIQNWDRPHLRMLAYMEIARKKKINLFSLPEKLICGDDVPDEFLDFLEKKFKCREEEHIVIKWRGREMRACGRANSIALMKHYFHYPDFEKEVEVDVRLKKFKCMNDCPVCSVREAEEEVRKERMYAEHYIKGEISDEKFFRLYKEKFLWYLERKRVFIAGEKCFGDNMEKFMEELNPKEWEKDAIETILKYEEKAIILEQSSSIKLLQKYDVNVEKLRREYEEKEKEGILNKMPSLGKGEMAEFIDGLARVHRIEGREGVIRRIKEAGGDVKKKAVSYAFTLAMGVGGEEWKYNEMEREFGKHLAPYVKKLLEAEGEEYRKAGEKLLREVG